MIFCTRLKQEPKNAVKMIENQKNLFDNKLVEILYADDICLF